MTFLSDTMHLLWRHILTTLRIPIWIIVMLVQPVVWLGLYGQLFRKVVEIPGFAATSYIQFLTPGVVVMTAFFGAAWSGMGILDDLQTGVMDRMLATPVSRAALMAARVLHAAVTVTVQCLIILLVGLALGARIPGGPGAFFVLLLIAALLASGISALSNGVALVTRREETLISVLNFFGLPLVFLSSAFMATDLMPNWIRTVARGNPVNWGVEGSRVAMDGGDWSLVLGRLLLLAVFTVACGVLATTAFRAYRRAV